MKGRMRIPGLNGICLIVSGLAGCGVYSPARTQIVRFNEAQSVGSTYPDLVAILRAEPSRPHERLGEVYVESSDDLPGPELEQAVREAAAKMGADAAVIVSDRSMAGGVAPASWWARPLPDARFAAVAVAIRYLQ